MKLASLEIIKEMSIHPNADKLELAKVLGFQCIVPKDQYKNEDTIIFIQPDTILPDSKWAETYKKYSEELIKINKWKLLKIC